MVAFADSDFESDDESDEGIDEDGDEDEAGDDAAELATGGTGKALVPGTVWLGAYLGGGVGGLAADADGAVTFSRQSTPLTSLASSDRTERPKRVVIRNYSRATVLAWVHWMMTGDIEFAPPSALGKAVRATAIERFRKIYPDRIAPVSAQSIYRIAEQCVSLTAMLAHRSGTIAQRSRPSHSTPCAPRSGWTRPRTWCVALCVSS